MYFEQETPRLFLRVLTPDSAPADLLLSLILSLGKILLVFILASIVENSLARGRFLLTHHLTWLGFSLAALSYVFWLTGL